MVLDLFPLNSVVFPYQKTALRIFEPRYLRLMEVCHREARSFGVCLIREGKEVGAPAIPFKIGTSVAIEEFTRVSDALIFLVVRGERRFRIERFVQEQPHIKAEVSWLDDEAPEFPGDYPQLRTCVAAIVKEKGKIPDDDNEFLGVVGTLLSEHLLEKQKIIELPGEKVVPCLIRFLESLG
ncbi:MAG: LON peptidase substrate-binding domain-containing protein [Candidatus Scalindua sp.]|nr:LON peptidase substrate-binding domain-containing protein [Candidatus Scalindua sp.]